MASIRTAEFLENNSGQGSSPPSVSQPLPFRRHFPVARPSPEDLQYRGLPAWGGGSSAAPPPAPPAPSAPGIIRRGCHSHAVPATWLGHPRLMRAQDSGRRAGSGATAAPAITSRSTPGAPGRLAWPDAISPRTSLVRTPVWSLGRHPGIWPPARASRDLASGQSSRGWWPRSGAGRGCSVPC